MKFRVRSFPKVGSLILAAAMALMVAFLLSGCGVLAPGTPTPLPTVVLGSSNPAPQSSPQGTAQPAAPPVSSGGGVTASGVVIAAQEVQIAASIGENVEALTVAAGDHVTAGQVLVRLAGSQAQVAAITAAQVDLLSAQQALQTLKDNAAQALAAAQLRLANAEKALDDAKTKRAYKQYRNGSESSIETAQADLILAENALKDAQDAFDSVSDRSENDVDRAAALSALGAARRAYEHALANLNYLLALPNVIDVNQAEAVLVSAQAEATAAQAEYTKLKNGPDPDALALAQDRITNAQAQIDAGEASLASLELKAPLDATVSKVSIHVGEWAMAGQTLIVLSDLAHLRVQTTDLSERDVPRVSVGQPVSVLVKALNQNVAGRVSEIASLSDTLGGDVVYQTTIDLDSQPTGLRPGMTVDVSFGATP
jgi:multidrug efflux pump subunit AcrA (membrane-fusion protein)